MTTVTKAPNAPRIVKSSIKSKLPNLRSHVNCIEGMCPLVDEGLLALNGSSIFNPFYNKSEGLVNSGYYTLTKDTLDHLIYAHNTKNRFMSVSHLETISKSVQKDGFLNSGDTIKFGWDGYIIDGQNRLFSAINTNQTSIVACVIFGLDPKINQRLPFPKSRKSQDILEEEGMYFTEREIALLKCIVGKYCNTPVTGMNIVSLWEDWQGYIQTTQRWLNDNFFKYDPQLGASRFWLEVSVYAVMTDRFRMTENSIVLDALCNPNIDSPLAHDLANIKYQLQLRKVHADGYSRILKALFFAHQAVVDGVADTQGLGTDKEWVDEIVFGAGWRTMPKTNLIYRVVQNTKELIGKEVPLLERDISGFETYE